MKDSIRQYLERKAKIAELPPRRGICYSCRKPQVSCYCEDVVPLSTNPRMVVLMHPLEARHPVGTGRMAHRCLSNSMLLVGADFADSRELDSLLDDPKLFPMLLFPGRGSRNLSTMAPPERRAMVPEGREPVVIVLDATWELAQKMLFHTPRLGTIPRIGFMPSRLSRFLVRKQPNPQCFSTIEAIHEILSLLDADLRPEGARDYDRLLEVFDRMVAKQMAFRLAGRGQSRHSVNYWARKERRARGRAQKKAIALKKQEEAASSSAEPETMSPA